MIYVHGPVQTLWQEGDTVRKQCITIQPAEVGTNLSSSKPPSKLQDIQDADNLLETVATGPNIEDQVDKGGHNSSHSTTKPVCHSSSKLGLGVRVEESHGSRNEKVQDKPKYLTVIQNYKLTPRSKGLTWEFSEHYIVQHLLLNYIWAWLGLIHEDLQGLLHRYVVDQSTIFLVVVCHCLGLSKWLPCPSFHIVSLLLPMSGSASFTLYSFLEYGFGEATWYCSMSIPSQLPLLNHHQEVFIRANIYLMVLQTCLFGVLVSERDAKDLVVTSWFHCLNLFLEVYCEGPHLACRQKDEKKPIHAGVWTHNLGDGFVPLYGIHFTSTIAVYTNLVRISGLHSSSLIMAPRYLNWWTVSSFWPLTVMTVVIVLSLFVISLVFCCINFHSICHGSFIKMAN